MGGSRLSLCRNVLLVRKSTGLIEREKKQGEGGKERKRGKYRRSNGRKESKTLKSQGQKLLL